MDWTEKAREFRRKYYAPGTMHVNDTATDQANMLASFAAEVERLTRQNEWVSVKERLPEKKDGTEYALRIDGGKNHQYGRWGIYRGDGVWYGDGGFMYSAHSPKGVHCVTHWHELPTLPEIATSQSGEPAEEEK